MSHNIKYCASCAIRHPERDICQLSGQPINPNEDFCSKHVTELKICDLCHQPYVGPDVIHFKNGESINITCSQCNEKMGHCVVCSHGNECKFETDPSPIPPVVMKTVRQGNMTMQTQVKNPERIKITCEAGCPCWHTDEEGSFCAKEFSTCGNYSFIGF